MLVRSLGKNRPWHLLSPLTLLGNPRNSLACLVPVHSFLCSFLYLQRLAFHTRWWSPAPLTGIWLPAGGIPTEITKQISSLLRSMLGSYPVSILRHSTVQVSHSVHPDSRGRKLSPPLTEEGQRIWGPS